MHLVTVMVTLLCAHIAFADLNLVSSVPENSHVRANALLSFTANETIQSTGFSFDTSYESQWCTFNTPNLVGQTVSITLLSCTGQVPISLGVTVLDMAGNSVTQAFNYFYDPRIPTLTLQWRSPNSTVKANTSLSFEDKVAYQDTLKTGITFVADGCHFGPPDGGSSVDGPVGL